MIITKRIKVDNTQKNINIFESENVEDLLNFINDNLVKYSYKMNPTVERVLYKLMSNYDTISLKNFKKTFHNLSSEEYPSEARVVSRYNKYFWLIRGYTEHEANSQIKELQQIAASYITPEILAKKSLNTKLSRNYWLSNGYSEEYTDNILKELQGRGKSFYKNKGFCDEYIDRKINQRNKKWQESLAISIANDPTINSRKGKTYKELIQLYGKEKAISIIKSKLSNVTGYSKVGITFCETLVEHFKLNESECHFKDKEFFISDSKNFYKYDFKYNNIIIEFHGDYWHMNPNIYSENDIHNVTKKVAKDVWDHDKHKKIIAENRGYIVLTVWESDWLRDSESVIKKLEQYLCIK